MAPFFAAEQEDKARRQQFPVRGSAVSVHVHWRAHRRAVPPWDAHPSTQPASNTWLVCDTWEKATGFTFSFENCDLPQYSVNYGRICSITKKKGRKRRKEKDKTSQDQEVGHLEIYLLSVLLSSDQ